MASALVDIIAPVEDDFLNSLGLLKGARHDGQRKLLKTLMAQLQGHYRLVPGGSACNTIVGAANLGINAAFAGKCGKDKLGALLSNSLAQNGVNAFIAANSALNTGLCLSLITPDSERTMLTDLGASNTLTAEDVPPDFFNHAGIAHFEAYMVLNRELTLNLLSRAHNAGCIISLDLGSFNIVKEHRGFLREIIDGYVDILIGNYSEGAAYANAAYAVDIIKNMAQNVDIAILKNGDQGSLLYADGSLITVAPVADAARDIVDTTGAGDLWNSGFLYGLLKGYNLETCGKLASLCGFEVCCAVGAQIEANRWQHIKNCLP